MPDLAQLIDDEPHTMSGLIQTPLYKEKVNGNLTGKHEADLLSVTGNTNKTYNDRYTQSINGHTEMEYNSRKVICNGTYTQSAEGDKTTTCVASQIQICLGLKSTQKIGPGLLHHLSGILFHRPRYGNSHNSDEPRDRYSTINTMLWCLYGCRRC